MKIGKSKEMDEKFGRGENFGIYVLFKKRGESAAADASNHLCIYGIKQEWVYSR
jgi:hypothetical protein